jgi:hypothetical protein
MSFRRRRTGYVTRTELLSAVHTLNERIDGMATQADVDALTTTVDQVAADLSTAQVKLQSEIDALGTANPRLDLTALNAAVAPLDSAVQALGALTPTPPAPAPPAA